LSGHIQTGKGEKLPWKDYYGRMGFKLMSSYPQFRTWGDLVLPGAPRSVLPALSRLEVWRSHHLCLRRISETTTQPANTTTFSLAWAASNSASSPKGESERGQVRF
jgi:hypothetical protein